MHSLNKLLILITLEVFHLEISGKDIKEEHPQNTKFKCNIFK